MSYWPTGDWPSGVWPTGYWPAAASLLPAARSCDIDMPVNRPYWTDTGMVLSAFDSLHLAVTFTEPAVVASGVYAYPEGAYLSPTPGYAPGKVVQDVSAVGVTGTPVVSNVPPFCVAVVLLPDAEAPPPAQGGGVTSGINTLRYSFNPWDQLVMVADAPSVSGWRVWAILNDVEGGFGDGNEGGFRLQFSLRAGATATLGYGQPNAPTNTWSQK